LRGSFANMTCNAMLAKNEPRLNQKLYRTSNIPRMRGGATSLT
jgi:hypothetical protein